MRALILAFAGGLAVAPSALAAPLAPERASNELGSRLIELVDHACGWSWHPRPLVACVPYGHAHRGTRLEHLYADWRAPTGGWGNPYRRLREPWPMIPSNAVKTAIDRAAEAIEAAENMFADEMGVTLDLSSAAKLALIATITASIRAAVAEERQRLVWADRVRWSESGPRITLARGTAWLLG